MTKAAFLADMQAKDPTGRNGAIQRHRAKVEAMTEHQFAEHYIQLERRFSELNLKKDFERMARQAF